MRPEGRYDFKRFPRERVPYQRNRCDGHHTVFNIAPKKSPLLDRPGEGRYSRYYSHGNNRNDDQGRSLFRDRRSGPAHRRDESGSRCTRDDHSARRQPDYRNMRGGFRQRSFYSSYYMRGQPPHRRDASFSRKSPIGRKDFLYNRSGSSVSSRSYFPERSESYSSLQSQHRSEERPVQSVKTSRDTSPSSSSAVSSSKVLEEPSQLTEKELAEATSKWAAEKLEKADEGTLPEISESGSTTPLFIVQPKEAETTAAQRMELGYSGLTSRSKAIASKAKEIEHFYRQDCETFRMVVKMLIEKDPSLENSLQFALRQNLQEIGERSVEELKHFIAEYDTSSQDIGGPF